MAATGSFCFVEVKQAFSIEVSVHILGLGILGHFSTSRFLDRLNSFFIFLPSLFHGSRMWFISTLSHSPYARPLVVDPDETLLALTGSAPLRRRQPQLRESVSCENACSVPCPKNRMAVIISASCSSTAFTSISLLFLTYLRYVTHSTR